MLSRRTPARGWRACNMRRVQIKNWRLSTSWLWLLFTPFSSPHDKHFRQSTGLRAQPLTGAQCISLWLDKADPVSKALPVTIHVCGAVKQLDDTGLLLCESIACEQFSWKLVFWRTEIYLQWCMMWDVIRWDGKTHETSEFCYSRIKILGNWLFLQSALTKLHANTLHI